MLLAILSDTHGLLRPEVPPLISGCDAIVHAGDVGDPDIVGELNRIAPTHAIRGNVDDHIPAGLLPGTLDLKFEGARIHVVHDIADLRVDPSEKGIRLVVFGHSHKPDYYERNGVSYLNPGSIGPRRFTLPISLALVRWERDGFEHEFLRIEPGPQ